MTENSQRAKIEVSKNKIISRLQVISKLQAEVPSLRKAEEEQSWMLDAEKGAPVTVRMYQSESLFSRLSQLDAALDENAINPLNEYLPSLVSSSGTASSSDYIQYVYKTRDAFSSDSEVQDWVRGVLQSYYVLS